MAVSMEAHFEEFDYALLDESTGTVKIVVRNEDTAWMSGLLRWLGGPGVHTVKDSDGKVKDYYRVGRALRDITFTGKGFVTNPANPDSIILTKSFKPKLGAANNKEAADSNKLAAGRITVGNTNNKGDKKMSDIDPIQYAGVLAKAQTADKLEKDNDKLQAKLEKTQDELVKAEKSISEFEFGKKEYETLLEAAKKEKEKDEKEKAELHQQLEAAKKEKEEDEKDKKEKAAKIESIEKELAELKANQQTAQRQAMLLQEGIEAKEVDAFIKTYASFNDEQFKAVASTAIESHRTKAALEQLKKDGKISAEMLEKMQPTEQTSAKEKEDEKEKCKEKSKASLFNSFSAATPKKSNQ